MVKDVLLAILKAFFFSLAIYPKNAFRANVFLFIYLFFAIMR